MANVIPFPHPTSPVQPVAHFIRLGESGYQKLASLHAAGRFPARRVVVDAPRLKHQQLAAVPDLNREQHFLLGQMSDVDRLARQVKDLKLSAEEAKERKVDADKLTKRLVEHSRQMEKMRFGLEDLHDNRADGAPRARPVALRVTKTTQPKAERK